LKKALLDYYKALEAFKGVTTLKLSRKAVVDAKKKVDAAQPAVRFVLATGSELCTASGETTLKYKLPLLFSSLLLILLVASPWVRALAQPGATSAQLMDHSTAEAALAKIMEQLSNEELQVQTARAKEMETSELLSQAQSAARQALTSALQDLDSTMLSLVPLLRSEVTCRP
jgi:hypothetical protein